MVMRERMIDTDEDEIYYPESSDDPWFEEQRLFAEGRAVALLLQMVEKAAAEAMERRKAEKRAKAEREARRQAEERVRALEEKLANLRGSPGGG